MHRLTKVVVFMLIAGILKRIQIEVRKDIERMPREAGDG